MFEVTYAAAPAAAVAVLAAVSRLAATSSTCSWKNRSLDPAQLNHGSCAGACLGAGTQQDQGEASVLQLPLKAGSRSHHRLWYYGKSPSPSLSVSLLLPTIWQMCVIAYPGGLGGSKEAMMVTMAGMGRALLPTGLVEGTRASRKCGTGPEGGGEAAGDTLGWRSEVVPGAVR